MSTFAAGAAASGHNAENTMANQELDNSQTPVSPTAHSTYDFAHATGQDPEKPHIIGMEKTSPDRSDSDLEQTGSRQLQHVNTAGTMGTTFDSYGDEHKLFRDGELVLVPAPSKDPKDPLNMSPTHKFVAIVFVCFFGALASAAELVLGAMLPVFAIQYAHLDPKRLLTAIDRAGGLPADIDPLQLLQWLPNAPPIWHVYLLASLPVLMIGVSNLFLIPLAVAIGRRPVLLVTGVIAIGGAIWAGFSQSLGSHLGARCVQAVGAGTIESLIPFIIQDVVHVHQRNTWIASCFATQGVIIIALGIASPHIIINLTWHYVYFITAGCAGFFLIGVFFFLPETRWKRTRAEMNGVPRVESPDKVYTSRTLAYNLAFFQGGFEWKKGWYAFVDTLLTFFYPQIFFITMLNSAMIACALAAGYTAAPALLAKPWSWPFLNIGLLLIPVLVAAILTSVITGVLADYFANMVAKARGKRMPENQLLNLILPTIVAIVGVILFGLAGQNRSEYSWAVFIVGLGMAAFGFLGANAVGAVYVLECYPHLAGPALVNIASVRCLIAFALSFKVSEWVVEFGYLNSMIIYAAIIAFFGLFIPVVYKWGPAWRKRWPASRYGDARHESH